MLDELQWPELQEQRQQALLTFFFKIHTILVTTDKNRCLSEAGNRSTRSHPLHGRVDFVFFPRTIATWNGLTTESASAERVDGFKSKI